MGIWLLIVSAFGLGFWPLVFGIGGYVGCIALITSNAMAVVMDDFPHMAGTAASLAGTIRFSTGAAVGSLLALFPAKSAWPMVGSMAFCIFVSVVLYAYASRPAKSEQTA